MARTKTGTAPARSIGEVLAAGWRLFAAGLVEVFPWVLTAELLGLVSGMPTGLLNTDISQFLEPLFLLKALLFGGAQTLLYAVAVLRLAQLAGGRADPVLWPALRSIPAVLIGYVTYTLVLMLGLGLGALLFALGVMFIGPLGGLVLSLAALAPTTAASTALAFFIYPAVLERRGPFASLSESGRLARGGWIQASLVVSVPALALLFAWLAGNGIELSRNLSATFQQMQNLPEDVSMDQLQALLAGASAQVGPRMGWGWRFAATFADAFAWWYTLAVCYAEYRALKEQDSARGQTGKNH